MVNTMGWNERSDPDMRTANFCDVYREGVYNRQYSTLHITAKACMGRWSPDDYFYTLLRDLILVLY